MSQFRFRAARSDGRVVSGILAAEDAAELDQLLLAQGLQPLESVAAPPGIRMRRLPSRHELSIVFRSLASLTASGIPVARAVDASANLTRNHALRQALISGRRLLHEGKSLAEALNADAGLIPQVIMGMVRAGERGSALSRALEQAALQLEHEAEITGRVQQALAYPLVLMVAGSASLLIITTVVVPRFAVILSDLGQRLPPATRLLLGVAGIMQHYGLMMGVMVLASTAAMLAWYAKPQGRFVMHNLLLRLPMIGPIRLGFASARVSRSLGGMLSTGMPILQALGAGREAAGDAAVAERLERVRTRLSRGEPVAEAFAHEQALTPVAIQIIGIGESSGQLGAMALRAGDLSASEAEGRLRQLVLLLEPGLIVLFGGLVAFAAAALLQAVYSLRPT